MSKVSAVLKKIDESQLPKNISEALRYNSGVTFDARVSVTTVDERADVLNSVTTKVVLTPMIEPDAYTGLNQVSPSGADQEYSRIVNTVTLLIPGEVDLSILQGIQLVVKTGS